MQTDLVNLPDEAYREKYGAEERMPPTANDDFNPEFSEVEIDGKLETFANVDGLIQMVRESDTPEARVLMVEYLKALIDLKEANPGPSNRFVREEAWKIAMDRLGIQLVTDLPRTGALQ